MEPTCRSATLQLAALTGKELGESGDWKATVSVSMNVSTSGRGNQSLHVKDGKHMMQDAARCAEFSMWFLWLMLHCDTAHCVGTLLHNFVSIQYMTRKNFRADTHG